MQPMLRESCFYDDPRRRRNQAGIFVRAFVCVHRAWQLLTYRVGRYRDSRDAFRAKRTIGFSTLVQPEERNLFNADDTGIVEAGVRVARIDLDIPFRYALSSEAHLSYFLWAKQSPDATELLALINLDCPLSFEPSRRRLALNDLHWIDVRLRLNNLEDFDPWSQAVLNAYYRVNRTPGSHGSR
jgi:hypothetical protein